jgi:hypothetical protein
MSATDSTPLDQRPAEWRRWLPRYSLWQLLLAMTFVAIGCYALRWASPWWAIVLFYVGLVWIVGGILIAINCSGKLRSFWTGFAVLGIAHMLLVFRPGLENGIPSLHPGAFVTTWLSAWTYQQVQEQLIVEPIPVDPIELGKIRGRMGGPMIHLGNAMMSSFNAGEDGYFRGFGPGPFYILEEDFVQVAHGLWTLLLAYVGGHLSLAVFRWKQTRAADHADERGKDDLFFPSAFICVIRGCICLAIMISAAPALLNSTLTTGQGFDWHHVSPTCQSPPLGN